VGFGLGVSVMATLLGVGEVVLDQARSPALSGGQCSLGCATNGAKVFYTLDGSFPANTDVAALPLPQGKVAAPVNQQSKFYTAPFSVKSGQTVRAAAYADGFNPGEILNFPVP